MKFFYPVMIFSLGLFLNISCGDGTEYSGVTGSKSKSTTAKASSSDQAKDDADDDANVEDGPDTPPPPPGDPNVVEFHIADGTAGGAWNTKNDVVMVGIGKTLRIINDDASGTAKFPKRLHTDGAPCPHMDKNIPAGGYSDCIVTKAYDFSKDAPIYNHNIGPTAQFFVKTTN